MASKTAPKFEVLDPSEFVVGKRGRVATIDPDLTEGLSLLVDGAPGVRLPMFEGTPKAKQGNVRSKILAHWANLHGVTKPAEAPALQVKWDPSTGTPQVNVKP